MAATTDATGGAATRGRHTGWALGLVLTAAVVSGCGPNTPSPATPTGQGNTPGAPTTATAATAGAASGAHQFTGADLAVIVQRSTAQSVTGFSQGPFGGSGTTLLPASSVTDFSAVECKQTSYLWGPGQIMDHTGLVDQLQTGDKLGSNETAFATDVFLSPTLQMYSTLAVAIYQFPDAASASTYLTGLKTFVAGCPQAGELHVSTVAGDPVQGKTSVAIHIERKSTAATPSISDTLLVLDGNELVAAGTEGTAKDGVSSPVQPSNPTLAAVAGSLITGLAAGT